MSKQKDLIYETECNMYNYVCMFVHACAHSHVHVAFGGTDDFKRWYVWQIVTTCAQADLK